MGYQIDRCVENYFTNYQSYPMIIKGILPGKKQKSLLMESIEDSSQQASRSLRSRMGMLFLCSLTP
jgi:hypothetical protein